MPQKQIAASEPSQTFESAIERLEQIVEAMEGDKLPLERLLEQYEEGSRLVKICQEKLEVAERRVELITRGAQGKLQAVPFDPAANAAPAPEPSRASTPKPALGEDDEVSLF